MYDINVKLEIAKKYLLDEWSIQYSFSKAKIKPHSDEYYFVYEKLKDIIDIYKAKKISEKRHPLHR
jgi:hypothetical protein